VAAVDAEAKQDLSATRVPYERAVRAFWLLLQGPMTTSQIAARLGVHRQTAWELLTTISRVVPVYRHNQLWQICKDSRDFFNL